MSKGKEATVPVEASVKRSEQPKESQQARWNFIPWNPWVGLVFIILVYFASQVIAENIVAIYPMAKHWSNAVAISWITNSIIAQFFYVLLAEALTLGAIYLYLRHYKKTFSLIGLHRPRLDHILYGFLMFPVYYIITSVVLVLIGHLVPSFNVSQQQEIGFTTVHGAAQLIMTGISLVILPPLTEEIMVRGFMYSTLRKGLPQFAAVIVTSALFASAHLDEGGNAGPLYVAAVDTFILSLALIYLREKTNNLWASMTLHACKNGFAFVALFILNNR